MIQSRNILRLNGVAAFGFSILAVAAPVPQRIDVQKVSTTVQNVVVPRPDVKGREGILAVHVRKIPLSEDVDISVIARSTPGFSGADLANVLNEAAILAARRDKTTIAMREIEEAIDRVSAGPSPPDHRRSVDRRGRRSGHPADSRCVRRAGHPGQ